MVAIGESYRPRGRFEFQSLLAISILGLISAILCAGLIWIWEISPVPTLMIVTSFFHGMALGGILMLLIRKLKTRNPVAVCVIAIACGLLSIGLVHYLHSLKLITNIIQSQYQAVVRDPNIPEARKREIVAEFVQDPFVFSDRYLEEETGHHGIFGAMILRSQYGLKLDRSEIKGLAVWALWSVEAFLVVLLPAVMAWAWASKPFCDDCRQRCKQFVYFNLPAQQAKPLVDAVRRDLPAAVAQMRMQLLPYQGSGAAVLTLHSCPRCDLSFADVSIEVEKKNQPAKKTFLAKHVHVSAELVQVCRAPIQGLASLAQTAGSVENDDGSPQA